MLISYVRLDHTLYSINYGGVYFQVAIKNGSGAVISID